jgi:hypothetical protein
LRFLQTRVIHVVTAVITAEGDSKVTTLTTEENGTAPATREKPKPNRKACVGERRAHLATVKAKPGRKADSAQKTPKRRTKGKVAKRDARDSKTARILDLLKRPEGVTSRELMKATGWQPHSVRGFLSGTVVRKMGLTITSTKGDDGQRTYSVKS